MTTSQKEIVNTGDAPNAIGPYSQAIKTNELVFLSGQIAIDPKTQEFIDGDIETQAKRVLDNLKAVVEAAGGSLESVVKTTIYLTDINDFSKVNAVYASYFSAGKPARSTVCVAALPKNAKIEIDAIAVLI